MYAEYPDNVVEVGLVTEDVAPPAQLGEGALGVAIKQRDAVGDGIGGRAEG